MKSEVKAIAISPNKDSIIYGGANGNKQIDFSQYIAYFSLKNDED
jgi:hypothetical protein